MAAGGLKGWPCFNQPRMGRVHGGGVRLRRQQRRRFRVQLGQLPQGRQSAACQEPRQPAVRRRRQREPRREKQQFIQLAPTLLGQGLRPFPRCFVGILLYLASALFSGGGELLEKLAHGNQCAGAL